MDRRATTWARLSGLGGPLPEFVPPRTATGRVRSVTTAGRSRPSSASVNPRRGGPSARKRAEADVARRACSSSLGFAEGSSQAAGSSTRGEPARDGGGTRRAGGGRSGAGQQQQQQQQQTLLSRAELELVAARRRAEVAPPRTAGPQAARAMRSDDGCGVRQSTPAQGHAARAEAHRRDAREARPGSAANRVRGMPHPHGAARYNAAAC